MTNIIKTNKLCKTFSNGGSQQHVLQNIDLEIREGDFTIIMGASGAGKERHGYIDHGTGNYMGNGEEPVKAMVKAWNTDSSNYTLQSVYDSAPSF